MAGRAATLRVDIVADAARAVNELDRIDGSVDKIRGTALKLAGAMAGAFAITKIADIAVDAAKAADEAQQVAKATDAIITATGGAAGVTADHVAELSGNLSTLAGVDDELIQQGANLILTFKNVKNAGTGLDAVFDRANGAAVDLAAAGFGSVESNATMLGKALNDPLAGLTALTRAGVTFSDQQKEQIKTLTESGQVLEAQKLILAEVESQVGGTAEASASSFDKMGVAVGNLQETLGAALLPIVEELLPVFLELLEELVPILKPVAEELGTLVRTLLTALKPALDVLIPVVAEIARTIGSELTRVIVTLTPYLPSLAQSLAKLLTALVPLIPTLVDLLLALEPIIPPLVELIAFMVEVQTHASGFANAILVFLVGPIRTAVDWLAKLVEWLMKALTWLVKVADKLSGGLIGKLGGIVGGIFAASAPISTPATAAGRGAARSSSSTVVVNVTAGLTGNPYLVGRQVVRAVNRAQSITGPIGDLR